MRLEGATIDSGGNRIPVSAGWVIGVHRDRRKSKGEVRVGDNARRRKPPLEIADLVGTGKLWVARGEFEILENDAKKHSKGTTMKLMLDGLMMFVVSLTPLEFAGKGSMRWAFRALFVPTEVQLMRLPIEEMTRPSVHTIEETAMQVALRNARNAPPPKPFTSAFNNKDFDRALDSVFPVAPTKRPTQPDPDFELDIEFDEVDPTESVQEKTAPTSTSSTTKSVPDDQAALLAYLQSLAYPKDSDT
jgi:hypothetical protein